MGLQIMTNTLAINAQRHLEEAGWRLDKVLERLASGSRINRAADDAAGLAISDTLNAETRSLSQAIRNASDGINLIQVFEGGTNEITNMLMRVRELSMQAASDTMGVVERGMIDNEVQQLKQEMQRVALTTKYGGTSLLSGEVVSMDFQVGINNEDDVDRIKFNPGDTDLTISALGVDGIDALEKESAQEALDILDSAIVKVNEIRSRVGSVQGRLQTTMMAQGIFRENLLAAKSRIRDTDLAVESSNLARETILRKAGIAVLTQANETPSMALQLLRG